VGKAKKHHRRFGHAVLLKHPPLWHRGLKHRWSWKMVGAGEVKAVKSGQHFGLEFVHSFGCPTLCSALQTELSLTALGKRTFEVNIMGSDRGEGV
jgi:hypothetical protein